MSSRVRKSHLLERAVAGIGRRLLVIRLPCPRDHHGDLAPHRRIPAVVSNRFETPRRTTLAAVGVLLLLVAQSNAESFPHTPGRFHVVRRGAGPTVIALGPVLDAVLAATEGSDVTVLHASTVRPFDARGLRTSLGSPEVVLVEPWLAGTSAHVVADALRDVPHRLLSLGGGRTELRRYGTPAEHIAAHGLDAAGIRASLDRFLAPAA